MKKLDLTTEDAELAAAALDGLAEQLAARAAAMPHGPRQLEITHAVGTLRRLARAARGTSRPA